MLSVEHGRIEVLPDLGQLARPFHPVQGGRREQFVVALQHELFLGGGLGGIHHLDVISRQQILFHPAMRVQESRSEQLVGQMVGHVQARHGILAVQHGAVVLAGDVLDREVVGKRGAAHQDGSVHTRIAQIARGRDHFVGALHQQSGKSDQIRVVLLGGGHEPIRRHLDAQVHHAKAVVAQDDFHQVLADVVDVPLDGGQQQNPTRGDIPLGHLGLQVRHGGLHRLGALQHFRHDEFVAIEQPAHLGHSLHEGAIDQIQRVRTRLQQLVQRRHQSILGAGQDAVGHVFVRRERFCRDSRHHLLFAKMRGEGGDRIRPAVPDHVVAEILFFLGDLGEANEFFRVDDRAGQARAGVVVQEHRVEHFATRRRQSKTHVGHAQGALAARKALHHQSRALDGLGRRSHVVLVAGAGRENQGVEHDVFFWDAPILGQDRVQFLGDLEFALGLHGHPLLVDATGHHHGSVALDQLQKACEALAFRAVFQVHGIEDALALHQLEGGFHHGGILGVDHEGGLHGLGCPRKEFHHVGLLVAVGIGQAHVDDVRARAALFAGDFGGFLEFAIVDQVLEGTRSDRVGALSHDVGPARFLHLEDVDSCHPAAPILGQRARLQTGNGLGHRRDVVGGGAAATSHHVEPTRLSEPRQGACEHFGRFVVAAELVGQPRIGSASHVRASRARQRPDMICHEFRSGGAVEAHVERIHMFQGCVESLGGMTRQHHALHLDGPGNGHRDHDAPLAGGRLHAHQAGLGVEGIDLRFQQNEVRTTVPKASHLHPERFHQFLEGRPAGQRQGFGGGTHGARHEADPAVQVLRLLGFRAGHERSGFGDFVGLLPYTVFVQDQRRGSERAGFHDVGSGRVVGAVHAGDRFRLGQKENFVAALEGRPPEIPCRQILSLKHGSHASVQNGDAGGEKFLEVGDSRHVFNISINLDGMIC